MNTRAHVFVSGHVQGVFFRGHTQRRANALNVTGWVRNLPDGRVEVVVEGEESAVRRVVSWCREGPPNALVTDVHVELPAVQRGVHRIYGAPLRTMADRTRRDSPPKGLTFEEQRAWMVSTQLQRWGIQDERVLQAMSDTPRELFVPGSERSSAYYDGALPIGEGQTISQPYVVAHMTELLTLHGHERVLEIGTGSGYQTAILAKLVSQVCTVERLASLTQRARATLQQLDIDNVLFHVGDGSLGWPEHGPYDAIIVTCGAPQIPPPLLEQLADEGRLVMPVGPQGYQDLVRVVKRAGSSSEEQLSPVAFVPLIGLHGW